MKESYDIRNYEDGITRKTVDGEFIYYYIKNENKVSDKDLKRINSLRIPPAWTNLWISNDAQSDIQAIGIDSKSRKQYIYHHKHIEKAEKEKFIRLYDFIKSIPILTRNFNRHKLLNPYDKKRVIVTMLMIVKEVHMRVGKEQYAKENRSYGISSLKKKHLKILGEVIKFNFKGKSNQRLRYTLLNPEIKNHLNILLKLDGDKLFQFVDIDDKVKKISDCDLNEYIQTYMGKNFTIKDFRTYAANFHFIRSLLNETRKRLPKNEKVIKKNILRSLKTTARYLKHTKAISKKSYVANFTIDLYSTNPEFFIQRKYSDPNEVLIEILQNYRKNIID